MTKIKNTKKGVAKKTLSMSLVVAMLATSNVPVWAAEFSDGSDVAVAHIYTDDADMICHVCGYKRTGTPPAPTEFTITSDSNGGYNPPATP